MADINVEKLKEKLYKVSKALFGIGETCVEASKQHISEKEALSKIRVYLNDAGVWSRFMVDQLIEDCMGPEVVNNFEEPDIEWIKKVLQEQPMQIFAVDEYDVSFPSCCDGCSNNPKNGGSGICNCTLPYMQDPIKYTVQPGDSCMANNTGGYVYTTSTKIPDVLTPTDIAETVERIKKYIRSDVE